MRRETGSVAEWIARAEASLALAKVVAEGVVFEDLCYQTQQAAEKALKAVYLSRHAPFSYIHNIDTLLLGLEAIGFEIPESVDAAGELTRYAVETRYPGGFEPITEEDHVRAVGQAEVVLAWARAQVGATGSGPSA
ncbi:MAG: HEPN domain-containing protein [Geothrix sp.]|nr:HEPN domain-containing protein [Geothrix sp.]